MSHKTPKNMKLKLASLILMFVNFCENQRFDDIFAVIYHRSVRDHDHFRMINSITRSVRPVYTSNADSFNNTKYKTSPN